jgi:hypothetical protein
MTSACVYFSFPLNSQKNNCIKQEQITRQEQIYAICRLPPPPGGYKIQEGSFIFSFFKYHNRPVWYP